MTNKSAIICGGWKRKSILILKGTIVPFNAFGNISQIFIRFVPPFKSLPSFFPLYFPSFLLHPSLPSFFPSFLYLFIQNLHWLPYQCSLPTHQPTPNNHMIPQLTDYVLLGFRYSAKKTQNIPVSPTPPPPQVTLSWSQRSQDLQPSPPITVYCWNSKTCPIRIWLIPNSWTVFFGDAWSRTDAK